MEGKKEEWTVSKEIRKKKLELLILESMEEGNVESVTQLLDTVKTLGEQDMLGLSRTLEVLGKHCIPPCTKVHTPMF
jgi:hypothetical protein